MLAPPPPGIYATSSSAQAAAQTWARKEGYAVVKRASAKNGKYIYLACDRHGKYRSTRGLKPEELKRKNSSAKSECPFRLTIAQGSDGKWTLSVVNSAHEGHGATTSALSHPIQRRLEALTIEKILDMAREGSKTRQIVTHLANLKPPIDVTPKDVSNTVQKHSRHVLQGRPPAEALVDWLEDQQWPYVKMTVPVTDTTSRLGGLLFAHPHGLLLLRRFGTVMTIDATYNTNVNRLPLLHFVGFTSSSRSFTAAVAFLPDETTITYEWALGALQELAPDWEPNVVVTDADAALSGALLNKVPNASHILCQWHVRQNVEKEARKRTKDDDEYIQLLSDFDEIRDARTLQDLDEARDRFMALWSATQPYMCDYVEAKLSAEHLWTNVYINRHPHMGTKTTSRTEGSHATLKQYLHSRKGTLFSVTKNIKNYFLVQHRLIESDLAMDANNVLISILGDPFFIEVAKKVSKFAINIVKTQDEASRRYLRHLKDTSSSINPADPITCACIIQPTMGLPCLHTLAQFHALSRPVPISCIHPQWRTTAGLVETRAPRLLDPLPVGARIQAKTSTTGRILTGNEVTQAQHRQATRRCKNCHQAGHNSNKCPEPCGRCKSEKHSLNQCPL